MDMSNVYEICFYGGLIVSIILFVLAIILFIVLKIPKVFGELTGRAAKKGIREKKNANASDESVAKKEQAKYYNQHSGKIKARDTVSKETRAKNQDDTTEGLTTKKEKEKKPVFTPQFDADETAVLSASDELDEMIAKAGRKADGDDETSILGSEELKSEDVKSQDSSDSESEEETTVLSDASADDEDATDVLKDDVTDEADSDEDEATDVLRSDDTEQDDEATDVLRAEDDVEDEDATDVLRTEDAEQEEDATDILRGDEDDLDATDILREGDLDEGDSTTVLSSNKNMKLAKKAKVIYNIVVVNTDEKI